jgi:hypothetical protein
MGLSRYDVLISILLRIQIFRGELDSGDHALRISNKRTRIIVSINIFDDSWQREQHFGSPLCRETPTTSDGRAEFSI